MKDKQAVEKTRMGWALYNEEAAEHERTRQKLALLKQRIELALQTYSETHTTHLDRAKEMAAYLAGEYDE